VHFDAVQNPIDDIPKTWGSRDVSEDFKDAVVIYIINVKKFQFKTVCNGDNKQ